MRYPWDDQPDPGFSPLPDPRQGQAGPGMLPPVSEPDLMSEFRGQQEQMPGDFWARLAQGAGPNPFGASQLPQKPTGLEVILAIAQGFGNAKAQQGARRVDETTQRNARAREAAKTLATWRHEERKAAATRLENKANLLGNRAYGERKAQEQRDFVLKNKTPVQSEYERVSGRIKAFKDAGLPVPGTVAGSKAAKPSTGQQKAIMAFYLRGKDAVDTVSKPEPSGKSLEDAVSQANIVQQGQMKYAPNALKSDEQQRYVQAQRAFTEARLRKESGAAINQSEYENDAKIYFKQPGDLPPVMAQKKRMRDKVLDGMKFGAGPAFDEYYSGQQSQGDVRWIMDDEGNLVPEQ